MLNLIGCGTTCGPISIGYEFEAMYVDGADTTDIAAELSERQLWTGTADYQKDIDAVSLFTARLGLDGQVVNADEYPAETGTMVDREDLHGAWIIEEGDSLRVLYHRPTGEGVEVTYRRLPGEETGP